MTILTEQELHDFDGSARRVRDIRNLSAFYQPTALRTKRQRYAPHLVKSAPDFADLLLSLGRMHISAIGPLHNKLELPRADRLCEGPSRLTSKSMITTRPDTET